MTYSMKLSKRAQLLAAATAALVIYATVQVSTSARQAPVGTATAPSSAPAMGGAASRPEGQTEGRTERSSRLGSGGGATTGPTSAPVRNLVTQPIARPPGLARRSAPQLPREYAVLQERSLFKKGRVRNPETETVTNYTPPKPQASLVFNGVVVDVGGAQTAFIEDMSAGKVNRLKVGDTIAGGKVTRITLDNLDYELDGRTVTVMVGQNLEGRAPSMGGGYSGGFGGSYSGGFSGGSGGSGAAATPPVIVPGPDGQLSAADRMRLNRLRALGQLPPGTPGAPGAPGTPGEGAGGATTQDSQQGQTQGQSERGQEP